MIDEKVITLLNDTLNSVRGESNGSNGWNVIISLYETAIINAKNNRFFSIKDAPRIYLEFNSDYTTDIFRTMDSAATETERYFKNILGTYIAANAGANDLDRKIKEITRYSDIFEEFANFILNGEKFDESANVVVEGYTAKRLTEETILTPLGAFNFLVYLREEPDEALADLKAKLPRRTLFDENKIKEASGMDENKNPVLEEENKESEVIEQAETEEVVEENATPEDVAPESEVADESAEQQSEEQNGGEDDSLSAVLEMLEKLQKSFDDKIAEDEYKNKLFDNMHKELTAHQNGAFDKVINTMAMDIIQLVDSIKKNVKIYEKKEPIEENYKKLLRIVKGLGQDLDDILYRQSIEPYSVSGKEVDVKRQKIIQIIDTDDQAKDNTIAARTADGYEKDGKVLRPERIKIYKYNPDAPKED